jgi:hypothetical protein
MKTRPLFFHLNKSILTTTTASVIKLPVGSIYSMSLYVGPEIMPIHIRHFQFIRFEKATSYLFKDAKRRKKTAVLETIRTKK